MKEITRIHLAKVAYDIEIDAKKDIQKYIAALERYAGDAEIVEDIEIRMTELLAERGVAAGGVIAKDDVAAVRAQLGEPSDFASEGDIAVGHDIGDAPKRRLFRDTDNAIAEGVLAGIGQFFGVDAVWVRLIFIVLLFASFGAAIIVYIILCIVVPPAKTAAEKLQMRGEPVTLEAIKTLSEQEPKEGNTSMATTRQVLRITAGIMTLIGAIGALCATLFIGFGLTFGTSDYSPIAHFRPQESWWVALALGLFVLAGLLLAALGFVLTNSLFRKQWNKRIGTAIVVIITAGLLSFVGGVGTVLYGAWQQDSQYRDTRQVSTVNLPQLSGVDQLVINGDDKGQMQLNVEYIVASKPRYEVETIADIKPQFAVEGSQATVTFVPNEIPERVRFSPYTSVGILRVYGPALKKLDVRQNIQASYYNANNQDMLEVTLQGSGFDLRGVYDSVALVQREGGVANLDSAAISDLRVDNQGGLVEIGVVRTLTVTQPEACPVSSHDDFNNIVRVAAISRGPFVYNGQERSSALSWKNACGAVIIGDEEKYTERNEAMLED